MSLTPDSNSNATQDKPEILISGAGVAGPLLALFLSNSNVHCTIVERSPSLRTTGQQIDIRGPALQIIKKHYPALLNTIRENATEEKGLDFIDSSGRVWGSFPVLGESDGQMGSFTSEIEILRGHLVRCLVEASEERNGTRKGSLEYVYGDHITGLESLSNTGGKVKVNFDSGKEKEYDLVIGADGMSSKTRRLVFPGKEEKYLKSLGQFAAYFTVPYLERDGSFARWYNAPLGRLLLIRPDHNASTSVYMGIMASPQNHEILKKYHHLSVPEQKEMMRTLFFEAGWETKRVLKGMDESGDFYMQEIAQVFMDKWSSEDAKVTLVGDSAYCPSPISGQGATVAVIGAYILAGELAGSLKTRKGDSNIDFRLALENYEKKTRPFVYKAQVVFPGAPGIANPQTWWGIRIFNVLTWAVSLLMRSPLMVVGSWVWGFFEGRKKEVGWDERLPKYEF